MRRFRKIFLLATAAFFALVILIVGLAFVPAVQRAVLLRALSGPETEVSVEEVRFRPGSAILSGFSLATPDARIQIESLDARFRLRPLLFEKTVHIESMTVSGMRIETEEPEDPPDVDLWEEFEGVLVDLPVDFRVERVEIDGTFRSPAGTTIAFAIQGRDLSSRDNDGRLDVTLNIDDANLPGDGRLFAAIAVRPAFDADGVFQQLSADLSLGESPGADPLLRSEISATRTTTGEDYLLMAYPAAGPRAGNAVLAAIGDWSREKREAQGAIDVNLTRDMLPPNAGIDNIPNFLIRGQSEFFLSESGGISIRAENRARIFEIAGHFGMPEEFDELNADLSMDIHISDTHLSVASINAGIARQEGVDLVRVQAPAALDIELGGDGGWSLPELDHPLLQIEIPGIPPELINLFLDGINLSSDPITAQMALLARNGGFELETTEPLSVQRLSISGPEGILLDESEIRLSPAGRISASGFLLNLGMEASLPQANSLSAELQSTGALPLSNTTSTLRFRAGGLPGGFPVSEFALTGTLETTHDAGDALPALAEIHLAADSSPRPDLPVFLPDRMTLDANFGRTSEGIPYELDIALPDPNGAETPPFLSMRGVVAPEERHVRGTASFDFPAWWAEILAETTGALLAFGATGDITYEGGLTPVSLAIESSTRMTVETGQSGSPGNGRFSLVTEGAYRLNELIEIDSFHASVIPDGRDALLRADLRQPVAWDGEQSLADAMPEGEIFDVEFVSVRIDEWLPEAQRGGLSGGQVSGGIRLSRNAGQIELRPMGEAIEIAALRLAIQEGSESPPLTLTMVPFVRINETSASFGVERFGVSTGGVTLLEASLAGGVPMNGTGNASRPIEGTFSLNGDLRSLEAIFGDGTFPNLRDGAFDVAADFGLDPANARAQWNGALTMPALTSTLRESTYAITADISGEATEARIHGRLLAEIDDGSAPQDLNLTYSIDPNPQGVRPRVEIHGTSEFLDLIRLEDLAGIFAGEDLPDDDTEPTDPEPVEILLPVDLLAEFTVSRLKVMPDFDLREVRIELHGDAEEIDLRQARVRFLDEAEIEIGGTLSLDEGTLGFASRGRGVNIDIADLLQQTQGVGDPDIEGVFSFDFEASSNGPDPAGLVAALDAGLTVTGERGRLRLRVPDQRMETIRRLSGMQEGAIGSVIARITGAPPGVRALAESINLLTDIPYDTIDVRLGFSEGRTLIIERLELAGPFLYAGGTGRLDEVNPNEIDTARLNLQIEIGADGVLREQFRILNLLSQETNSSGYRMIRRRPVSITGTVGDPNLREVWDLLIQAGTGAATARETPEEERPRDPVDDAVDGIRGILGW